MGVSVCVLKLCYISDLKLNILVCYQTPAFSGFWQNLISTTGVYNFILEQ